MDSMVRPRILRSHGEIRMANGIANVGESPLASQRV